MKRFSTLKSIRPALLEAGAAYSSLEAEELVGIVYPLLLKRSLAPRGLVDYSHKRNGAD